MSKLTSVALALVVFVCAGNVAWAKGPSYGGGHHSGSHGGQYRGGKGSSHKGGQYKNPKTGDKYGKHK